jgi:mono/diheme cytochrome c family protein
MNRETTMRAWFLCVGMFAMAVLLSAQGTTQTPSATTTPAGNAANGKKVYLAKGCWTCHDYEAQGGNGPRLSSTALPLRTFTSYIRAPRGGMPPYLAKVVSDTEVADIYAWVQAIPKPTPAKNIPLLNP